MRQGRQPDELFVGDVGYVDGNGTFVNLVNIFDTIETTLGYGHNNPNRLLKELMYTEHKIIHPHTPFKTKGIQVTRTSSYST